MPQPSITKICLKITYLEFHSNFLGANELSAIMQQPITWACVNPAFIVGDFSGSYKRCKSCAHEVDSFALTFWFFLSDLDFNFLAATKQLYKWYFPSVCPSVRLSVRLSHLFHHVPIIVSSWNFQELLPWSKVMSMQKVKVRGQRSRSQRSTPNLAVSGL